MKSQKRNSAIREACRKKAPKHVSQHLSEETMILTMKAYCLFAAGKKEFASIESLQNHAGALSNYQ